MPHPYAYRQETEERIDHNAPTPLPGLLQHDDQVDGDRQTQDQQDQQDQEGGNEHQHAAPVTCRRY
jgi:hypothetical protein